MYVVAASRDDAREHRVLDGPLEGGPQQVAELTSLGGVALLVVFLILLAQLHQFLVEVSQAISGAEALPGKARPHMANRLTEPLHMLREHLAGGRRVPLYIADERELVGEDDHLALLAELQQSAGDAGRPS